MIAKTPAKNQQPLALCTGLVPLKAHYLNNELLLAAGKVISQDLIDKYRSICTTYLVALRPSPDMENIVARNKALFEEAQKELKLENMLQQYDADTLIFEEGDTSTELYVLIEGEIEVIIKGSVVAVISEPGSYFGEMAILRNEPRSASLHTTKPCRFYVVPGKCFPVILKNNPEVGLKIAGLLAERLAKTTLNLRSEQEKANTARQTEEKLNQSIAELTSSIMKQDAEIKKFKDAALVLYHKASAEYNGVALLIKSLAEKTADPGAKAVLAALLDYMNKASTMPAKGKPGEIRKDLLGPALAGILKFN
jgi:CRP-like cAMP-binding protein